MKDSEAVEVLAQAMWDARTALGFDPDGDSRFHSHDWAGIARRHVEDAKEIRKELDQCLDAAIAVERVKSLHASVKVWQYDDTNGVWVLDADGEKILLSVVCRECSGEAVLQAIEDCEYKTDWYGDEVFWPCPTVVAINEVSK